MIMKLIVAVICVAFVAGTAPRSTRDLLRTQTTHKVHQKQGSSPPKQELLVPLVTETRDKRSTQNDNTPGSNRESTGHYQHTAGVHQSESNRTGHRELVTSNNQIKSDPHKQITDQQRPTSERFKTTKVNHSTRGYLHKTTDLPRSKNENSTDKYNKTTRRHTEVTQLFQSQSKSKTSQPSSIEHPQNGEATDSPSLVDDLILTMTFLCNDGKFRIYSSSVCDGQIDCPDGSDELPHLCVTSKPTPETRKCRRNEFTCPTGKCVHYDSINFSDPECWEVNGSDHNDVSKTCSFPNLLCDNKRRCVPEEDRCNGVLDCNDQTDEMISPFSFVISNLTFTCANGYCVSPTVVCNGYNDCGDNSDEIACDDHKIPNQQPQDDSCTEYSCTSGTCISNNQVCDGNNDCGDDSDESTCDGSVWFWSDNRGLVISVSVLGGTLLITIVAVICVSIHYKRKFKNLTQETNSVDNHPPPYWQVVGVSVPGPLEKTEPKTTNPVNVPYGGTTALPE